jgi:thiol-disulfide isomerase/thioredoxin
MLAQNCIAQSEKPFTIKGTILSAPQQKIYLRHDGKFIDSCLTTATGEFTFRGSNREELPYSIYFKYPRPRMIYLALHDETLRITIESSGRPIDSPFPDFTMEGSPSSYALNLESYVISDGFASQFRVLLDKINKSNMKGDKEAADSLQKQLDDARRKFLYAHKNTVDTTRSPVLAQSSIVGMEVIMDLLPNGDMYEATLDSTYVNASNRFPTSTYFQNFYGSYQRKKGSPTQISKITNIKEAPFFLPDRADQVISYQDLEGKYLLIDFWASWCKPCREEHPHLRQAYERYGGTSFEIVSISIDKVASRSKWLKAIEDDQVGAWVHLLNVETPGQDVIQKYHFSSIPYNLLVAPDGKILATRLRGTKLLEVLAGYLK